MEYKSENRTCQNCKNDFTIEPDDFSFYEKIKVPPPTFCPECRMIRRFNFRNERYLFRRKNDQNGEEIFSGFSPKANIKTYENSYWFSDNWDPLENGFDYDFSKNFFDQFRILMSNAPIPARSAVNLVNSDYCNEISDAKNSFLCLNCDHIENGVYLRKCNNIKDSLDSYGCTGSEICYEDVNVNKSYQTIFSVDCENCVEVWFSKNCVSCNNCLGCANLVNKSYYIFNEPFSKSEYLEKIKSYSLDQYSFMEEFRGKAEKFWLNFPNKFYYGLRNIDSIGEKIFDTKNVKYSHSIRNGENLRFCQDLQNKAYNSYDYSVQADGSENIYEYMIGGLGCYNCKFCFNCWINASDLEYCIFCVNSKNCFGCVGLYKKQYCIFNKQYTKEEFFVLREKIIKNMNESPYIDSKGRIYRYGEFFPFDLSIASYNESLAQDYFPLTKEEAEERGYIWWGHDTKEFTKTMLAKDLPDNIIDVDESILKEVIECKTCKLAYKIIDIEYQFYKKLSIPLPRNCNDCRFVRRFKFENPPKFYGRQCMCENNTHDHSKKCQNIFETTYSPERPEIVYCEKCYQQEVY